MDLISFDDFSKIQMKVGTIIEAKPFDKAKKPAFLLLIDFGLDGIKKSSAQITDLYNCEDLIGKQVIAVVNFPKKQVADIMSECLILGAMDKAGKVVLLTTDIKTDNGLNIH